MTDGLTIYALASGAGRAGVAVIRVSGPEAGAALANVTRREVPPPRLATLCAIYGPQDGALLDKALVLWMPGPASFTGEDCAEIHVHGGRAVIDSVLVALAHSPGCRMAVAGEFTRRALMNDKMDLTQVEALADLIEADTQAQQSQALGQMQGHLGALYLGWGKRLLHAVSHMEAAIDFADEELPDDLIAGVRADVAALAQDIQVHLADNRRGERLRDGIGIAILGAPNVGKSSLLNALALRDVAIVSDIAGTTRDVLDVYLDLGGYPVVLSDTAGIRAEAAPIEAEGIRRALARADEAAIRLVLMDAADWPHVSRETYALIGDKTILVINKVDAVPDRLFDDEEACFISVKTGEGLDALLNRLEVCVKRELEDSAAPGVVITRARHREALQKAITALERFLEDTGLSVDLAAEELRLAIHALGRITGRVDVEDFLDVIFKDFCIGK